MDRDVHSSGLLQFIVEDAVRDVERHVMLWSDQHARQINDRSSVEQILVNKCLKRIVFTLTLNVFLQQYFQLDADLPTNVSLGNLIDTKRFVVGLPPLPQCGWSVSIFSSPDRIPR